MVQKKQIWNMIETGNISGLLLDHFYDDIWKFMTGYIRKNRTSDISGIIKKIDKKFSFKSEMLFYKYLLKYERYDLLEVYNPADNFSWLDIFRWGSSGYIKK